MNFIKKIKGKSKFIMIGVIIFTISTLTFSYSALFEIKANTTNQVITTGDLSVTYGSGTDSITDLEMLPMSDTAGLASSAKSIIVIQNTSSLDSYFTLTASYDLEGAVASQNYPGHDFLLPMEYLKAAIYEYDPLTQQMTLISDVINIGNSTIYKTGDTYYDSHYSIYNSSVDKSSSGNNIKTFAIKIWVDEDVPEEASQHYVYLKINVESEVKNAVMNYNVSGNLKSDTNTNINGGIVSLNNGAIKATTNSSGNFTLNGVREGIYSLSFKVGTEVFYSSLEVCEEATKSLEELLFTKTPGSTVSISDFIFESRTTILLFKEFTGITTPSSFIEFEDEEEYDVPPTYKLCGGDNVSLGTLNIKLSSEKFISEMTLT